MLHSRLVIFSFFCYQSYSEMDSLDLIFSAIWLQITWYKQMVVYCFCFIFFFFFFIFKQLNFTVTVYAIMILLIGISLFETH